MDSTNILKDVTYYHHHNHHHNHHYHHRHYHHDVNFDFEGSIQWGISCLHDFQDAGRELFRQPINELYEGYTLIPYWINPHKRINSMRSKLLAWLPKPCSRALQTTLNPNPYPNPWYPDLFIVSIQRGISCLHDFQDTGQELFRQPLCTLLHNLIFKG
jgi:hypothetical protein